MKAVGARVEKVDGIGHVTGQTTFVDDWRIPGMLWAKVLRSPHDHAAITKLDVAPALALPGVRAVITHEDVPKNVLGHLEGLGVPADEPLLAESDVRWKGQPIAVVAADSEEAALAGVAAIGVSFEERPALFDVRLAFEADAPKAHHWGNWFPHFGGPDTPPDHRKIRKGDIDAAFEQADAIVQGVYRPNAIEQMPVEPQVCACVPESNGRLTIHSCTQGVYFTMGIVASHLGVPLNRLKFIAGTVGGGFGGKVDSWTEPVVALLALKTGKPVKLRFTREEEFLCTSTRAPWHIEIADAVTSDGWILGRKMLTLHDAGAYARFSPYGVTKHSFHIAGSYAIPNVHFDGYVVFTNRTPTSAMRGFGVTSVSWTIETQMSRIASVLGLDPYEVRLRNASRIGDTTPNWVTLHDPSSVPVIQAAAEAAGVELTADYRTMTRDPRSGDLLPEWLEGQLGDLDAKES